MSYGASRRRRIRREDRRRGQSLVELALIMPFLIMLITGIMDVGLMIYAHLELTHAAQEVTKLAGLNRHTPTQLETIFETHVNVQGSTSFSVTTAAADADFDNRPSATINMTLTFPPIGLAKVFRSSDITFTSRARMPVMTQAGGGLHPVVSP